MAFDLPDIGARVRAYRLGAGYSADELARQLGVSRAALYRIEQGDIVKIDVLQSISRILGASLASLLGAGAEYHANAASYLARMQQLEAESSHIVTYFSPLSYLLTTDDYDKYFALMLGECLPADPARRAHAEASSAAILQILRERKAQLGQRRMSITCLVSLVEVQRFLALGLVGRRDLPAAVQAERKEAARAEIAHLSRLMRAEPVGVQIGLIEDLLPNVTFQLFYRPGGIVLGTSPFRIGELPNLQVGVATITAASDAVAMHEQMFQQLWSLCSRGQAAARQLDSLLER